MLIGMSFIVAAVDSVKSKGKETQKRLAEIETQLKLNNQKQVAIEDAANKIAALTESSRVSAG